MEIHKPDALYLAQRIDSKFRHAHELIGGDESLPSAVQLTEAPVQGDDPTTQWPQMEGMACEKRAENVKEGERARGGETHRGCCNAAADPPSRTA